MDWFDQIGKIMIIYKTTNLINGKIYVGRDSKNNADYFGSGTLYLRAEKKYGKENFKKTVIDLSENFDELCQKEIFWINFFNSRNPDIGYNVAEGGRLGHKGCKHSPEACLKMSIIRKNAKASASTRQKLRNARIKLYKNNDVRPIGMTGKAHSEASKQKIRAAVQASWETRRNG